MRRLEQDWLAADLAAVDDLLASAPPGDVLGRVSLTERRDEVRTALAEVGAQKEHEGRTALFFGGAPVIGNRGIDADFAAEALGKYQDLVTKVLALKEHGSLAASRREARLHVTNVIHGSFGFELAELQGPLTLQSSPLHDAVRIVTRALIAAGKGDDDLADAAEELDVRSFAALKEFFAVLQRAHATFRVVADEADYAFDPRDVELAAERTDASRTEEQDVPFAGEFLAVLPEARRFEFRTAEGVILRGRVADELTADDLRNMNAERANQACTAHVRVVTLTRRGRSHTRYVLRRLESANAPKVRLRP
jgi:hypothetical protein